MAREITRRSFLCGSAAALAYSMVAGSLSVQAEETAAQETISWSELTRVSVHDPSVIAADDGNYYILGSHIASAKSEDMIQWTQLQTDYADVTNAPFYGDLQETFAIPFQWAGYDDGDCAGGNYAIWAPDIIWDPYYECEDGTTGAYLLYCCTSSTWRRSCIVCLASKTIDGTYSYVDTLIYSGFTKTGETDGTSTRDTSWDNDYLNLASLVEAGSENGGFDEISDNWFASDGGWDHTYAPNAIDPNLFFDAAGEKLYMSYGSWSGGLYLLEIDPKTGKAIYPGVDSTDEISGNYVDRYFGTHLAGGNHQSGEGPYILYDSESGYYYLYETYGSLTAEGGYNMRLFRSENLTGPYVDAKGGNSADSGTNNEAYGIKLIGNYCFYGQTGKRSAGHNSALIDTDGSRYLVYHQRFDTDPITEAHEVRVHQQFLNEDLWPVTAVYEYIGEKPENYEDSEVTGSYEYINHGTTSGTDMLDTAYVTLNEDGTVEGSVTGTWSKADSGNGYDYVTLTLDDGATFKGIFFRQHKECDSEAAVMTFTAIGDNNECVWGSQIDTDDTEMVLQLVQETVDNSTPSIMREGNMELPTSLLGATIVWESSDPDVIAADGTVTYPEEDVKVELSAEISCNGESVSLTHKVIVRSAS
ncbi:MAG: glycoside hydrolase family 43 protein [Clostridiales bacterium]|nr:glycoside hydrolase family 43 protein [Clostridiales bacterium]